MNTHVVFYAQLARLYTRLGCTAVCLCIQQYPRRRSNLSVSFMVLYSSCMFSLQDIPMNGYSANKLRAQSETLDEMIYKSKPLSFRCLFSSAISIYTHEQCIMHTMQRILSAKLNTKLQLHRILCASSERIYLK